MNDRTRGTCKYCGMVHPDSEIANPHYCIARLEDQLADKDKEIERLQTNLEVMKRAFRLNFTAPTAPTPVPDL